MIDFDCMNYSIKAQSCTKNQLLPVSSGCTLGINYWCNCCLLEPSEGEKELLGNGSPDSQTVTLGTYFYLIA